MPEHQVQLVGRKSAQPGRVRRVLDQHFPRFRHHVPRPVGSNRVGRIAVLENNRAHVGQLLLEQAAGDEIQVAFLDRRAAVIARAAFLHLRPHPADVTGIDGDAQALQRLVERMRQGAELGRRAEPAHRLHRVSGRRKIEGELRQAFLAGGGINHHPRIVDVEKGAEGGEWIVEGMELRLEFLAGKGALVKIERKPRIGRRQAGRARGCFQVPQADQVGRIEGLGRRDKGIGHQRRVGDRWSRRRGRWIGRGSRIARRAENSAKDESRRQQGAAHPPVLKEALEHGR